MEIEELECCKHQISALPWCLVLFGGDLQLEGALARMVRLIWSLSIGRVTTLGKSSSSRFEKRLSQYRTLLRLFWLTSWPPETEIVSLGNLGGICLYVRRYFSYISGWYWHPSAKSIPFFGPVRFARFVFPLFFGLLMCIFRRMSRRCRVMTCFRTWAKGIVGGLVEFF